MRTTPMLCLLVALAACTEGDGGADALDRRRIALGLDGAGTLEFAAAMEALEDGLELPLNRAALGRLEGDGAVDAALRIASILERTDPTTAGDARAEAPEDFDARLKAGAAAAETWARAALEGDAGRSREAARGLLDSCVACHKRYRR